MFGKAKCSGRNRTYVPYNSIVRFGKCYVYALFELLSLSFSSAQSNCAAGQWRVCASACLLGVGSCRNAWCEECVSCPPDNYCPGDNQKYTCPTCRTDSYLSNCNGSSQGTCVACQTCARPTNILPNVPCYRLAYACSAPHAPTAIISQDVC
jgi:hypothetical protein